MTTQAVELELLRAAAGEISAAAWGTGTAVAADWAGRLGMSKGTLLRKLKDHGLYDSGRKTRSDKGRLSISEDVALQAAGMMLLGTRNNDKKNFLAEAAADVLYANGKGRVDATTGEIVKPAASTLRRAMRHYRCHPDQLSASDPAMPVAYKHPNQCWQVDSSVCVLFYAPGGGIKGIQLLDDAEVYKNKLDAIARVQADLCLRWMAWEPYSGAYYVGYQAGHESALGYIDFMIEAMQDRGDPFRGVPFSVYLDKGASARAEIARNWHERLGIEVKTHKVKNSRAKGGVEGMHNIWERLFESRLFMWQPESIEALNAKANMVRLAHCSSKEHSRHGKTRFAVMQAITAAQYRPAPSPELLRELVTTNVQTRTPDNYLCITYSMRRGAGSQTYRLHQVPGVIPGEPVRVVVNPYREPAVDVLMAGPDGTDVAYTVMPVERDAGGYMVGANVWGEEIKSLPRNDAARQLERVMSAAFGVPTREEAERERKARANAYEGVIQPFADYEAVPVPAFISKRGTAQEIAVTPREEPPVALPEAVRKAKAAGVTDPGLYARWSSEFGSEVPQAALDAEIAAFRSTHPNLRASA